MARKASVRYWASRGAYMCHHKGKQHLLASGPDDAPQGPTYAAALEAFVELVTGRPPRLTIAKLIERYLGRECSELTTDTTVGARQSLAQFAGDCGSTQVDALTDLAVNAWIAKMRSERDWGDATVNITLTRLRACLTWGREHGLMTADPMKDVTIPAMPSRGLECVLEPAHVVKVLGACKGALHDLLTVLRETGCRPGELRIAERLHFNRRIKAIVIPAKHRARGRTHKTGRFKKDRVIYLPPASLAIVERLCEKHPTGPLFRSGAARRKGPHAGQRREWTPGGIVHAVIRLREKCGLPHFIAYSFRHTFAVRALERGVPVAFLATIMGTSIKMIVDHYGHLTDQHEHLYKLACEMNAPPVS